MVVVKKVLTDKQECYQLQGKKIDKETFLAMIRSAGFSPRNPCNVVRQGQVAAIATGGDERRSGLSNKFINHQTIK